MDSLPKTNNAVDFQPVMRHERSTLIRAFAIAFILLGHAVATAEHVAFTAAAIPPAENPNYVDFSLLSGWISGDLSDDSSSTGQSSDATYSATSGAAVSSAANGYYLQQSTTDVAASYSPPMSSTLVAEAHAAGNFHLTYLPGPSEVNPVVSASALAQSLPGFAPTDPQNLTLHVNFFIGYDGERVSDNLDLAGNEFVGVTLGPWVLNALNQADSHTATPSWSILQIVPQHVENYVSAGSLAKWTSFSASIDDLGTSSIDLEAKTTFGITDYSEPIPDANSSAQLISARVAAVWVTATRAGSTPVVGDLDGDGQVSVVDIDLLAANAGGSLFNINTPPRPRFDLNRDLSVDFGPAKGDSDLLIRSIIGSEYGDANLDGFVDIHDFNIWNANKFTIADSWGKGDFDGNGMVDVTDLNIWNQYRQQSDDSNFIAFAVPELAAAKLITAAIVFVCFTRLRQRS